MNNLLKIAIEASKNASEKILEIYGQEDFAVEIKDDKSPLTAADKASHNAIVAYLEQTNIPILSEESKEIPYEIRKNWNQFWLVDPLDGTKEFMKRNGEFTVNIALIENGIPVLGVVQIPVKNEIFVAIKGEGAFKVVGDKLEPIKTNNDSFNFENKIRFVASRSHMDDDTKALVEKFPNAETVSSGSSLKFILVATDKADVYPRFAPTMEWDTAAAHIIVEESGGFIKKRDLTPMEYNKENLLNPHFIVFANESYKEVLN